MNASSASTSTEEFVLDEGQPDSLKITAEDAQQNSPGTPKLGLFQRGKLLISYRSRIDSDPSSPRRRSDSSGATGEPMSPSFSVRLKHFSQRRRSASTLSLTKDSYASRTSDLDQADVGDPLAVQNLENILAVSDLRTEMVSQLLAEHRLDLVLRIRFISAIQELIRTEDLDRQWMTKARKVVDVFLDRKSKFRIDESALPPSLVAEIQSASAAQQLESLLMRARGRIINDLVKIDVITSKLSN